MKGFIVDETYRIEDGKVNVYLFGRLENGESFMTVNAFVPYFCIRKSDLETARKIKTLPYTVEETDWKTMADEPAVKLVTKTPKDVPPIRDAFEQHKIPTYEADIRFTQRFLIDHGILRTVKITGAYERSDYVGRVYREPRLEPTQWYPDLCILSFDIESSMDGQLYSISLVCEHERCRINEVLLLKDTKKRLRNARLFSSEKEMLEHFRQEIIRVDPDIITGWNTIDFDLAVLRKRFAANGVPFRMARQDWDCTLRIESSFMRESTAEFPGRQVLDGIQMLRLNFISLPNYKLATAAHEILGEEKLIGESNKGQEIEDAYEKDPQKLVDYNLKDSQLVLDILRKTHAVDIMVNRSLLTGMPLDRVRGSVASFDSLYLRELRRRGYVAPSSAFAEKEEQISGGYVMSSRPGLYENLIVVDFKSLYPSIMRTFNIDPLSYEQGKKAPKNPSKDRWITAPNGVVFANDEGILPGLLQQLWDARDRAKRRKDAQESLAIKILMNSFFGVLAAPVCRFFSLEMANAITAFGRHFIQMTVKRIEEMGYTVIYADTDSAFVDAKAKTHEEAMAVGERISKEINRFYEEHVRKEYHRESFMELQPDKVFVKFLMPHVRGSEAGAKKRYAGIVRTPDGKEELDVTGLEIVRRDWTDLAKGFQTRLLHMIFNGEDPSPFIRQFIKDLKAGKHDRELVYQKAVRKELESYTKTTPPHVKAARLLQGAGIELESNIMEYVMTADGPYPVQLLSRKKAPAIDYEHYVEKQLKPIADGILTFMSTSFDDVMKGSRQQTLGSF